MISPSSAEPALEDDSSVVDIALSMAKVPQGVNYIYVHFPYSTTSIVARSRRAKSNCRSGGDRAAGKMDKVASAGRR